MLETALLEKIINAWVEDQGSRSREVEKKPPPDIRDVRALIEGAFLASLEEEEGRPTKFCISLLQPNDVTGEPLSGRKPMVETFSRDLPLRDETEYWV